MEDNFLQIGLELCTAEVSQESQRSKDCAYFKLGYCVTCGCDKCHNGNLIDEWRAELKTNPTAPVRECPCVQHARNRKRLIDSGLSGLVERYTFGNYRTDELWQQKVKEKALSYLNETTDTSFFVSGQTGSGKTHICTAICNVLMGRGKSLRYMQWVTDSRRLKGMALDNGAYEAELIKWSKAEVLYIDDLFKVAPSEADIRLLYEIIGQRYNNRRPTIISTERDLEQLLNAREGVGEAVVGRIFEMCGNGKYCLNLTGEEKNMRFFGAT